MRRRSPRPELPLFPAHRVVTEARNGHQVIDTVPFMRAVPGGDGQPHRPKPAASKPVPRMSARRSLVICLVLVGSLAVVAAALAIGGGMPFMVALHVGVYVAVVTLLITFGSHLLVAGFEWLQRSVTRAIDDMLTRFRGKRL